MTQFSFSTYTVTNGTAVPTNGNPKPEEKDYYQRKSEGISWGDYYHKLYSDFEQWKQSHTYATNCKVDGVYPKECFGEPIKQYWDGKEWGNNSVFSIRREFIPFIEQPEPTPDKQAGETVIGNPKILKLNEAADKWVEQREVSDYVKSDIRFAFKQGSQWQSTQSYSREEVEGIVEEVFKRVQKFYDMPYAPMIKTKDLLTK